MTIKGVIKYGQYSVKHFSSGAASLVDRFTKINHCQNTSRSNLDSPFKLPQVVFDQGIKESLSEFLPTVTPSTQFKHSTIKIIGTPRDEIQTETTMNDHLVRQFAKQFTQLGLDGIEVGSSFKSIGASPDNTLAQFQYKMAYSDREIDRFISRFNVSTPDLQNELRQYDWRMLVMTSKNKAKNKSIASDFATMQKKLNANCQIILKPAVVTYADQEYGQKNSRMSLDESTSSVMDFYDQLTEYSTGIDQHLYVYISGIVGVSELGRQEFGINHYALNTQRIIQTLNGYKLPFTPIYGDTTGLGNAEDFKTLNQVIKPDSQLELHLHHQSTNTPADDFKRLVAIFNEFDQHIPLTIHGGIFSGGSPFSGRASGFGANCWFPFIFSLMLQSNLTTSNVKNTKTKQQIFENSLVFFLASSMPRSLKVELLDSLKIWHQQK
jgi:hypothetical protein